MASALTRVPRARSSTLPPRPPPRRRTHGRRPGRLYPPRRPGVPTVNMHICAADGGGGDLYQNLSAPGYGDGNLLQSSARLRGMLDQSLLSVNQGYHSSNKICHPITIGSLGRIRQEKCEFLLSRGDGTFRFTDLKRKPRPRCFYFFSLSPASMISLGRQAILPRSSRVYRILRRYPGRRCAPGAWDVRPGLRRWRRPNHR